MLMLEGAAKLDYTMKKALEEPENTKIVKRKVLGVVNEVEKKEKSYLFKTVQRDETLLYLNQERIRK